MVGGQLHVQKQKSALIAKLSRTGGCEGVHLRGPAEGRGAPQSFPTAYSSVVSSA